VESWSITAFLVRWLQALLLPVVRLFDSLRVMLLARHFYW
jgi:hypothetical protein